EVRDLVPHLHEGVRGEGGRDDDRGEPWLAVTLRPRLEDAGRRGQRARDRPVRADQPEVRRAHGAVPSSEDACASTKISAGPATTSGRSQPEATRMRRTWSASAVGRCSSNRPESGSYIP